MVMAVYSIALALGRPQATAPSASASTNIYRKAGPLPDRALAASISRSSSASSRPQKRMSSRQSFSVSSATRALRQ